MLMKRFISVLISFLMFFTPAVCFAEEQGADESFLSDQERQEIWLQETAEKASQEAEAYSKKQRLTRGSRSWRDGVICVTDSFAVRSVFNNGHAGIVDAAPDYDSVIEANPGEGAKAKFEAWTDRTGFHHVYQAGEISTTEVQGQKAAVWAGSKIGTPYKLERYRLNRRDVFYCSY